jgi:hypothetical protein
MLRSRSEIVRSADRQQDEVPTRPGLVLEREAAGLVSECVLVGHPCYSLAMRDKKHAESLADNVRSQLDKFRDLARELECDEDEAKFEGQVRQVAKATQTNGPPDASE